MQLKELDKKSNLELNVKLNRRYLQLEQLINELKRNELPQEIISSINNDIEQINAISDSEKGLKKQLKTAQTGILKLIEKELKLVTKNHYRNTWLAVGISIGVGIGAAIGSGTGNMSLLGIGIPIGMAIAIAIGTSMDKKASDSGKQLNIEIKY